MLPAVITFSRYFGVPDQFDLISVNQREQMTMMHDDTWACSRAAKILCIARHAVEIINNARGGIVI